MAKQFNKKQREILARKLGYDGPMNMFDQFVKSDPAMEMKYNAVVDKYMARGGVVKKYAEGGAVTEQLSPFMQVWRDRDPNAFNKYNPAFFTPEFKQAEKVYGEAKAQRDQFKKELDTQLAPINEKIKQYESGQTPELWAELSRRGIEQVMPALKADANYVRAVADNKRIEAEYKPYVDALAKWDSSTATERSDILKGFGFNSVEDIKNQAKARDVNIKANEFNGLRLAVRNIFGPTMEPRVGEGIGSYYMIDKITEEASDLDKFNTFIDKYIPAMMSNVGRRVAEHGVSGLNNGPFYQDLNSFYAQRDKLTEDFVKKAEPLYQQEQQAFDTFGQTRNYTTAEQWAPYTKLAEEAKAAAEKPAAAPTTPTATTPTTAPAPTVTGGATQDQMTGLGVGASTAPSAAVQDTVAGGTAPTTTTPTVPVTPTTTPGAGATDTVTAGTVQDQMAGLGVTGAVTGATTTATPPVTATTTPTTPTTPSTTTTAPTTPPPVTPPTIPGGGTTGTTATGTTPVTTPVTTTGGGPIPTTTTVPAVNIPQVTAATIPTEPGQMIAPTGAPEQAAQIAGVTVPGVAQVTPTTPQAAATMEAATATGAVSGELAGLQPEQGAVSQQAQVQAATMEPTSSALAGLQAAQTTAGQVQGAPTRELVAGELVEGPTVDRAAVEATLAKNEAAQGVVTEDMTVQGQLAKLTSNFEANNPPAWAAGALRNVTAILGERGLAASSLAGQALIQATIESALPIASADAQIYREMGIQNLTNKQQMAVLSAQQRAAFLGQEFDQAFQTRVTNAATISEIANLNFSAKQQIALENARLTESVNLANLNNRQALVMANAAQIATLETANLNNRQQANVLNAQAFLQMDLTNLSNRQQTALFKSQSMIQSILSDQAAENSARQFNASSVNQVNQFYDGLTAQVKQFNATQANAMNQFNVSQINSVSEFNANQQNARDQFNADFRRVIDQSNAEWRRNIALADTAAINRANEVNANAALAISTIEYNNLWQSYRDNIEYAWKTGENALDRENELARQVLAKQATIEAAKFQIEAAKYQALGNLAAQVFDKGGLAASVGSFLGAGGAGGIVTGAAAGIRNLFTTGVDRNVQWNELTNADQNNPGAPAYGWKYYSDGVDTVAIDPRGSVYYNGNTVVDDQLAYTNYVGLPGVSQNEIYGYGQGVGVDYPYSYTGGMEGE